MQPTLIDLIIRFKFLNCTFVYVTCHIHYKYYHLTGRKRALLTSNWWILYQHYGFNPTDKQDIHKKEQKSTRNTSKHTHTPGKKKKTQAFPFFKKKKLKCSKYDCRRNNGIKQSYSFTIAITLSTNSTKELHFADNVCQL